MAKIDPPPPKTRTDNKLVIKCDKLTIDMHGSADQVTRAYRAMREQLTEAFYETINTERGPNDRTLRLTQRGLTDDDAAEETPENASKLAQQAIADNFLNLVFCQETHHKVYLIDDTRFEGSFLGEALTIAPLGRVYIDSAIEERVRSNLDVGSTLWRTITPAGKAAMLKGD